MCKISTMSLLCIYHYNCVINRNRNCNFFNYIFYATHYLIIIKSRLTNNIIADVLLFEVQF